MRIIVLNTKIITVSSGKGGVGKTCTAVNLSILLAQQGYRVCLFDADANLANVNIMLKLAPEYTLEHVISGQKQLNDIILYKAGIQVIPGASGLDNFIKLETEQQQRLQKVMQELKTKYDYLIIDNPAGISENVLSYIKFSDEALIVITPEPTSLTDAFALIRVLHRRGNNKELNIIVNNVSNKDYANKIFNRFQDAVTKHIGCELNYLGYIISDKLVAKSVCLQKPLVLQYPASLPAHNLNDLSIKVASLHKQRLKEKTKDNPLPSAEKTSPVQQPDFSGSYADIIEEKHSAPALPLEQQKTNLINNINNINCEQAKIKETLQQINDAYLKRFGDYVIDLSKILDDALKMDRISKPTMKNLILTLHGLYQDQYGIPFEIKSAAKEDNLEKETIEHLIKLLQQRNPDISLAQDDNNNEKTGPILVSTDFSKMNTEQELLSSLRYAAMVDN